MYSKCPIVFLGGLLGAKDPNVASKPRKPRLITNRVTVSHFLVCIWCRNEFCVSSIAYTTPHILIKGNVIPYPVGIY